MYISFLQNTQCLVGWGRSFLTVAWPIEVHLVFSFAPDFSNVVWRPGSSIAGQFIVFVSPRF